MTFAKTMLRKQAERLCNAFGIISRVNEKPGAHLPYSHPKLEAVRVKVQRATQQGKATIRLMQNMLYVQRYIYIYI